MFLRNRICYAPAESGGGSGGGSSSGAPSTVTTNAGETQTSAAATTGTTAGEVAKVSHEQTSASAAVPAGVGSQPADPKAAGDFRAGWDDTLKNDPSLKDFKDTASLAKALVDTKKLVGQKLGIPGPDASPEAKAAFHEALGVPKEAAGYEFKAPEGLPEKMAAVYDEKHSEKWAGFFKDLGIPKEAAQAIRNKFFEETQEELKTFQAEADKSDEEFGKMAAQIYGDNKKADQALQNVRTMVEKHVPDALKAQLNSLSNSALLIVAAAIKGETEALTGEDKTINRDGGGNGNDGKTVDQLRAEARELQALPEYSSPFTAKGKQAHAETVAKVKAIYDRIGKMG